MKDKERKRAIKEAYRSAREWLSFARSFIKLIKTIPDDAMLWTYSDPKTYCFDEYTYYCPVLECLIDDRELYPKILSWSWIEVCKPKAIMLMKSCYQLALMDNLLLVMKYRDQARELRNEQTK